MLITFDELRRVKDSLPSGSMEKIAENLGISPETVRNYFGGTHYEDGKPTGIHVEQGGNESGVVKIDDTKIYDEAIRLLGKVELAHS